MKSFGRDALLSSLLLLTIAIIIVPMPPQILDLLLALSFTLSTLIFLAAIYLGNPLEFTVFPSILLLTTMLRLSLNVASTRLILVQGAEGPTSAGHVIAAFGNFVTGGNYVVGLVMFIILMVINFVVITKGSGRIAEVAARFALDGLPGKQMAIDAELAAGAIDETTARKKRQQIEQEADFYGAMDGASKFVRGDAIAGLIIVGINIIGGILVGMLQQGLPILDALTTYTLLTVGDGLVSQIPALLISLAAGLVVTRSAESGHLGESINIQLGQNRKIFVTGSIVLAIIALAPGMPFFAFAIPAILSAYWAFRIKEEPPEQAASQEHDQEEYNDVLAPLDILELEVGYGLVPLVDSNADGSLLSRIVTMRTQIASELGIQVPPVHIRDNLSLEPQQYRLLLKGNMIGEGILRSNRLLAISPSDSAPEIPGESTLEPAFGMPALWIEPQLQSKAEANGYTIVSHDAVIITHLTEIVRRYAHELIGRQEVRELLDKIGATAPAVVDELVPNLLSLGQVVQVLKSLLEEHIPIRDLREILEVMADIAPINKDISFLVEQVRKRLSRTISRICSDQQGTVKAFSLGPDSERSMQEHLLHVEGEQLLALPPVLAGQLINALGKAIQKLSIIHQGPPVLLVPPHLRRSVWAWAHNYAPQLIVISPYEIDSTIKFYTSGRLDDEYDMPQLARAG